MIDQGEFFDIESPCKRICELNNKGYCKGCFRSRDERLYWNQYTPFQKQLVANLCEKRRLKIIAAKLASNLPTEEVASIPQLDLFNQQEEHQPTLPPLTAEPPQSLTANTSRKPGEQFDLF